MPEKLQFASKECEEFFLARPGGPCCLASGYGAGKTHTGVLKLLWIADKFPNARLAIVRRTASQLRKTVLETMLAILPQDRLARYSEQSGILEFVNGSKLFLIHLDSPDSLGMLRSLELNAVLVEQAEELSEEAFNLLVTRVGRWTHVQIPAGLVGSGWKWYDDSGRPSCPAWTLVTLNSPGYDHWSFRRFSDDSPEREKWKALDYRVIYASSRDNRYLPKQVLAALLANDDEFIKRFVDFSWGTVEGTVHEMSNLSILEPTDELVAKITGGTMRLHRTFDYGLSSPTACVWWGVDKEGNIFGYRSYAEPNLLIREHRANITSLSPKTEHYLTNLMDPSAFHKTAQKNGGRWSMADEFAESKDLPFDTAISMTPADNNEAVSRTRINEALWVDPKHRHPITGQLGAPHLYFLRTTPSYPHGCSPVIQDIKSQRLEVVGEANGRKLYGEGRDPGIPDHSYDCVRYAMASHFVRPPERKYDPLRDPGTFLGYSRLSKKLRDERRKFGEDDWGKEY